MDTPGHRSGPRALALSSDDAVLLSAAAGEVKLWNPRSGACLRSIDSGQVAGSPIRTNRLFTSTFTSSLLSQSLYHGHTDACANGSCSNHFIRTLLMSRLMWSHSWKQLKSHVQSFLHSVVA